jgi:hypothetical protein
VPDLELFGQSTGLQLISSNFCLNICPICLFTFPPSAMSKRFRRKLAPEVQLVQWKESKTSRGVRLNPVPRKDQSLLKKKDYVESGPSNPSDAVTDVPLYDNGSGAGIVNGADAVEAPDVDMDISEEIPIQKAKV